MKTQYKNHNGEWQDYPDMDARAKFCDENGHVKNCCTPENDGTHWCAYCARPITKDEYEIARSKP